jgi:hypothetical protein
MSDVLSLYEYVFEKDHMENVELPYCCTATTGLRKRPAGHTALLRLCVTMETCLLATTSSTSFTIPAFSRPVTMHTYIYISLFC